MNDLLSAGAVGILKQALKDQKRWVENDELDRALEHNDPIKIFEMDAVLSPIEDSVSGRIFTPDIESNFPGIYAGYDATSNAYLRDITRMYACMKFARNVHSVSVWTPTWERQHKAITAALYLLKARVDDLCYKHDYVLFNDVAVTLIPGPWWTRIFGFKKIAISWTVGALDYNVGN